MSFSLSSFDALLPILLCFFFPRRFRFPFYLHLDAWKIWKKSCDWGDEFKVWAKALPVHDFVSKNWVFLHRKIDSLKIHSRKRRKNCVSECNLMVFVWSLHSQYSQWDFIALNDIKSFQHICPCHFMYKDMRY